MNRNRFGFGREGDEMSQINLTCIDQDLLFTNKPTVSSGNVQADKVAFTFNEDWTGRAKTAVFFVDPENPYYQLLDDADTCMIPDELLADDGKIFIGVFGVKDGTILTSTLLKYKIETGAVTTATPGVTDELWTQILEEYEKIDTVTSEISEDQEDFLVEGHNVIQQAYDALSSIQVEILDMDGGDPTTAATSYTTDIDGGPPEGEEA